MMRLPEKMPGNSKQAREWNKMVDCLAALIPLASANSETQITTRGTIRRPRATTGRRGGGSGVDRLVWL